MPDQFCRLIRRRRRHTIIPSANTTHTKQQLKRQPLITAMEFIQETANSLQRAEVKINADGGGGAPTTTAISELLDSGNKMDAFEESSGPIVYMSENRMPAIVELRSTMIYIILMASILALLAILPGVRRTKLNSLLGLLTVLLVGASILLALNGSHWLTGSVQISSLPYSSQTGETISGRLQVNIGLSSANVTLWGKLSGDGGSAAVATEGQVNYNERFSWDQPDRMANEHTGALRRGLPYPILTVTEHLSHDSDGFNWSRQLRQAGHFTTLALYAALASWCLTTIVMCVLPVYLAHMMQLTGALMLASVWIYTLSIESPESFAIQVGGQPVEFAFGASFATTFAAGALSLFAGLLLLAVQLMSGGGGGGAHGADSGKQLTIMDSEQFVNDRKALYQWRISSGDSKTTPPPPLDSKPDLSRLVVVPAMAARANHPATTACNSVIIPIADIEEQFRKSSPIIH